MPDDLKPGDPAPDFALPADDGSTVRLEGLRGRSVVLYFYPKDDTSGCTSEAQGFTAAADDFRAAGAEVVGVSKDSVKSHAKFRNKYGLDLRLLSDESGEMVERYGAWVEKSMYGRKYMGVDRSTFLIGGDGVIRRVWRKVKVPGHVQEVLAAARELSA
ncbi:MAG TPA: peroxiredoxin [Caulobacteraceae bacterium]|jgi:peroxiredoxin Q/BCP